MKSIRIAILTATFAVIMCATFSETAQSQPPSRGNGERGPEGPRGPGRGSSNAATTVDTFIAKWLTMDANADGQLAIEELKDDRLQHLFKASDKNSDGVLSKDEMKLLFETSNANSRTNRGRPSRR